MPSATPTSLAARERLREHHVATVLTPVVVRVVVDAATDTRVATVIEHVVLCGATLLPAGQTAFAMGTHLT